MPDRPGLPPQRAPSTPALISFLFGLADRESIPGPALIVLLGELGIGEGAARSAIARMRTAGELATARRGRVTDYGLAGVAASGFRHARSQAHPDATPTEQVWEGEFAGILYSVPERLRRHRDRLRTAALLAGYTSLRPGLLIAIVDRWEQLEPVVSALPADIAVCPVTLGLRADDARSAAAEAWELAELNHDLGRHVARLRQALEAPPERLPSGSAALRRLAELTLPVYHSLVVVPPLPTELLPERWCQPELVDLLGGIHQRFGPAAQQHVHSVLAASP